MARNNDGKNYSEIFVELADAICSRCTAPCGYYDPLECEHILNSDHVYELHEMCLRMEPLFVYLKKQAQEGELTISELSRAGVYVDNSCDFDPKRDY